MTGTTAACIQAASINEMLLPQCGRHFSQLDEVLIVMQQNQVILDRAAGDQAVERRANCEAATPSIEVEIRRGRMACRWLIKTVKARPSEVVAQARETSRIARTLQDFHVVDIGYANRQRVSQQIVKQLNMRRVAPAQIVDPNRGVDQVHQAFAVPARMALWS